MNLLKRNLVVGVFGHVDHGKTTLLDKLAGTTNAFKEFGNITQSIRPQELVFENVKVVFLDTPGHEAFTNMRKIISQVVHFGFILISKKDGFMPQTQECLSFLIKNKIKFKVLLSKSDTVTTLKRFVIKQFNTAGIDPAKGLSVSSVKDLNLNKLLKLVMYSSKLYTSVSGSEVKKVFKAYILDIFMVKGLGVQTLLMIKSGFLNKDSFLKTNTSHCKVRNTLSFSGGSADGSCVVKVSGWSSKPNIGELVWASEKGDFNNYTSKKQPVAVKKVFDLKSLFSIQKKKIDFILKADNEGSLKALSYSIKECFKDLKNIDCSVLYKKVGGISKDDLSKSKIFDSPVVYLSSSANVRGLAAGSSKDLSIFKSNVIYTLLEDVTAYVLKKDLLWGDAVENCIFKVKRVFSKERGNSFILGCQLLNGELWDKKAVSLYKDDVLVNEGLSILNLKVYKNKVSKVVDINQEFGLKISSTVDISEGDTLKQF